MDKLGIILSGFAEVRGLSFPPRFTRQWLCLTGEKLLICRDSSLISEPIFTTTLSELSHLERVPLRRFCLHIYAGSKRLHFSFTHQEDLEAWTDAIHKQIHPVLLIGEPQDIDDVDELFDLLSPLPTTSNQGGFWDDDTLASPSLHLSEGPTLVEGSFSGTSPKSPEKTYLIVCSDDPLCEEPSVQTPAAESDPRPSSPVDPYLVFDQDIIRFENSGQRLKVSERPRLLLDLTGQVTKEDQFPFATGGFADVWLGTWNTVDRCHLVAVKVIRAFAKGDKADGKIEHRLNKELDIWKCLQHRHILPLFGVCHDMGRYASMISPWMRNGNAAKYFERRHDRECFVLSSRLKLLREVAAGLEYLHMFSPPVIHGDLKASNILIGDGGEALLSDFGISTLIEDATGPSCFSSSSCLGSVRWMAFELVTLGEEHPQLTTWCDVWSYGSTALEILSGKMPYSHRKNDIQVFHEVMRGIRPQQEGGDIPQDIWAFISSCWSDTPDQRPTATKVRSFMDKTYRDTRRMGLVMGGVASVHRSNSTDIGSDFLDL